VKAGHGLPPITAGIGVWLNGVGEAGTYGTAERMTSQMPGGRSRQQRYENRRSICKDRFQKTRHKMCRYQLNGCMAWMGGRRKGEVEI